MDKPEEKRKGGRHAGAKATKRNKNSPPVNQWEMENGAGVPQTGTTVFGSEARNDFRGILTMLQSHDSWDSPEPVAVQDKWQAVASLPEGAEPEPWKYLTEKWLWDWLAKVGIGRNGLSFPPFAVRVALQVMRLHPEMQMELESFALSLLRFGTHTLRALVEKEPQGFELTPVSFEQRPVSGKEALTGLAKMVESPEPDKKRQALFETAQRLRLIKFDAARSRGGADSFLMERDVEISFHELVMEHTGQKNQKGEIINWLKEGPQLETLRRYAHQLAKAGTIKIKFSG